MEMSVLSGDDTARVTDRQTDIRQLDVYTLTSLGVNGDCVMFSPTDLLWQDPIERSLTWLCSAVASSII